jgi:hypothetical protein
MASAPKTQHAIRRSTRLPLEVPLLVTSLDPADAFSEQCNTILVNAHGCGMIVPRALVHGFRVQLEIVSSKRHAAARVAEVVPLGGEPETWLVGLELDVPGNFWGIEYAPSDWKIEDQIEDRLEEKTEERTEEKTEDKIEPKTEANRLAIPQQRLPDQDLRAEAKPVRSQRWRLTDISAGACYLETVTPFPIDTPVVLSVRASNTECLLEGTVRTSYAQTGMGVEFAGAQPLDQRARVDDLIDRLINNREVPKIFVGRKEGQQAAQNQAARAAHGAAQDDESPDLLLRLVRSGASLTAEQFLNDLRAQRLGNRRDRSEHFVLE